MMKRKGQPITVELKKYTKADLEPRSFKDHNDLIVRVPSPIEVATHTIRPLRPTPPPSIPPPGGRIIQPKPRPDPVQTGKIDNGKIEKIDSVPPPREHTQ